MSIATSCFIWLLLHFIFMSFCISYSSSILFSYIKLSNVNTDISTIFDKFSSCCTSFPSSNFAKSNKLVTSSFILSASLFILFSHFFSSGSFSNASAFAIITAIGVFSSCDASATNCFCLLNDSITGFIIHLVISTVKIIIIISINTKIKIDVFNNDSNFALADVLSTIVNVFGAWKAYEYWSKYKFPILLPCFVFELSNIFSAIWIIFSSETLLSVWFITSVTLFDVLYFTVYTTASIKTGIPGACLSFSILLNLFSISTFSWL